MILLQGPTPFVSGVPTLYALPLVIILPYASPLVTLLHPLHSEHFFRYLFFHLQIIYGTVSAFLQISFMAFPVPSSLSKRFMVPYATLHSFMPRDVLDYLLSQTLLLHSMMITIFAADILLTL